MSYSWQQLVIMFLIYSFIGWLWETIYCSLKDKKFDYRGFLEGPYCPIYGFGIVSVLVFVDPYQGNWLLLYVLAAILVTVLEYLTSYFLELFFHTTWWDYDDVPLNINGRVALPISLFWGLACVLIVKVVNPQVMKLVHLLDRTFGTWIAVAIILIFAVDTIYTVTNMYAFQKLAKQWSEEIENRTVALSENMHERRAQFDEKKADLVSEATSRLERLQELLADTQLKRFNQTQSRYAKNYHNLNMKSIPNFEDIKAIAKARAKDRLGKRR